MKRAISKNEIVYLQHGLKQSVLQFISINLQFSSFLFLCWKAYLHTFDNRNYLVDATLDLLEQELDPKEFFRISRKFIIPLQAIKEIVVYSNSRLKLILPSYKEEEVIVSREKVSDFKSWIS